MLLLSQNTVAMESSKLGHNGGQNLKKGSTKNHDAARKNLRSAFHTTEPRSSDNATKSATVNNSKIRKQKATVPRPRTIALESVKKTARLIEQEVYNYMVKNTAEEHISGIQSIDRGFEVTFKTQKHRDEFVKKTKIFRIGEVNFIIKNPREVSYMKKEDLIDVYIYRYPVDEGDQHLRKKLQKYGELVQIQMINKKNTKIGTETRCAKFRSITGEIPTTLFCRGRLIKTRHEGQDRQPICSRCKVKGHNQTECKKNGEEEKKKKEPQMRLEVNIQKSRYIRLESEHPQTLIGPDSKHAGAEQKIEDSQKKKIEARRKVTPKKAEERRPKLYKKKEEEEEDMKNRLRTTESRSIREYPDYRDWKKHQTAQVIAYFQDQQLRSMYAELKQDWQIDQRQKKDPD